MDWENLLSVERLAEPEREPEAFDKYPINEFEKDYQAIITSAAFRRLQDKTQVFPLDQSDFVRTRLTHSIEVSTVARQMGEMEYGEDEALYFGAAYYPPREDCDVEFHLLAARETGEEGGEGKEEVVRGGDRVEEEKKEKRETERH